MPQIKVCGIRNANEAEYLNRYHVDYAGFVLYPKSKRYLTIDDTQEIIHKLNKDIIKVALAVSPNRELMEQIEKAGFDILQIHGTFDESILSGQKTNIKVWRAVNVTCEKDISDFNFRGAKMYDGFLLDAKNFGSGKTFGWDRTADGDTQKLLWKIIQFRNELKERNLSFVLAGGLNEDNVERGIEIFHPDIVDVSSGVENEYGKEEEKIKRFVGKVRKQ